MRWAHSPHLRGITSAPTRSSSKIPEYVHDPQIHEVSSPWEEQILPIGTKAEVVVAQLTSEISDETFGSTIKRQDPQIPVSFEKDLLSVQRRFMKDQGAPAQLLGLSPSDRDPP